MKKNLDYSKITGASPPPTCWEIRNFERNRKGRPELIFGSFWYGNSQYFLLNNFDNFLGLSFSYLSSKLKWEIKIWYVDLVGILDVPFERFSYSVQYLYLCSYHRRKIKHRTLESMEWNNSLVKYFFLNQNQAQKITHCREFFFFLRMWWLIGILFQLVWGYLILLLILSLLAFSRSN